MESAGIPIDDLNAAVVSHGVNDMLSWDGGHMTDTGKRILAQAVVAFL